MKKLIIILFASLTFLFLIIDIPSLKDNPSLIINNKKFNIDIAKSVEQKEKGLSIYDKLPLNKGMIFVFNTPEYYAFWMKDMKFPIDIIYIRKNKIIDIFKNVPAPKSENETLPIIKPKETADMVFEINAGLSDKYNFKIGDLVEIKL